VIILIAGGLLTFITIGLFSLIEINIADFYFENIVICGLAASPIVGTYLIQTNPKLVHKVSHIIARIFSPLVLITLIIYLIAIVYSGKDPYNDREFLLVFNALLIGVMALIIFSIAESSKRSENRVNAIILSLLAVVTIFISVIALSAILFRIIEWGMTPNKLAVLGGNIIILANLIWFSVKLFKAIKKNDEIHSVEKIIARFLPIYGLWMAVVTFLFPIIFRFG
jgi:hypothetical protein